MELKTLALDLGMIRVLQAGDGQPYQAGWYLDPVTGQRVYYDPETQNFYTMAGGVYIPLGYMNPSPKQVAIAPAERLRITISYKYSGPAITGAIEYFSVGVYGTFGFDEKLVGKNTRNLPASTTPTAYTGSYTFTMPADVGSNWDDIYCKIYSGALFGYENALVIIGKDPAISDFTIADFVKV
jgi:hypothetical protein